MHIKDSPIDWKSFLIRRQLRHKFYDLEKITDKWGYIRQVYMEMMPHIMCYERMDPYFLDWATMFSPIERMIWADIRGLGVTLYPQFPVFNYFIDFANPRLRIGVEVDGAAYHDKAKDQQRDQFLADYGWKIFRISGSEAMRTLDEPEPDENGDINEGALTRWAMTTGEGVISAIKDVYFGGDPEKYNNLPLHVLDMHRLAEFEIHPESPVPTVVPRSGDDWDRPVYIIPAHLIPELSNGDILDPAAYDKKGGLD